MLQNLIIDNKTVPEYHTLSMKKILPLLSLLFFVSCFHQEQKTNAIFEKKDFYDNWNANMHSAFLLCCRKDSIPGYLPESILKMQYHRKILFDTLLNSTKHLPLEKFYVTEGYSEGNESNIYRMSLFVNKKGERAHLNYKKEIFIDGCEYEQIKNFEINQKCCSSPFNDFMKYQGFIPINLETLIEFKEELPTFKTSLYFGSQF